MPISKFERYRRVFEACVHEGKHAGYLHDHGVDVHKVEVDQAGNGVTTFTSLEPQELSALYRLDRQAAYDRVIDFAAACLAGNLTSREVPDRVDIDQANAYALMWSRLSHESVSHVLERARRCALGWLVTHAKAIEAFAHVLDQQRSLCGAELQAALHRTFGTLPQPSPRVPLPARLSTPVRAPIRKPAAALGGPPAKPRVTTPTHMWWDPDGYNVITSWTDVRGGKHHADGRLVHPNGETEHHEEWRSQWILYPDGTVKFVGPSSSTSRPETPQHPKHKRPAPVVAPLTPRRFYAVRCQ